MAFGKLKLCYNQVLVNAGISKLGRRKGKPSVWLRHCNPDLGFPQISLVEFILHVLGHYDLISIADVVLK